MIKIPHKALIIDYFCYSPHDCQNFLWVGLVAYFKSYAVYIMPHTYTAVGTISRKLSKDNMK